VQLYILVGVWSKLHNASYCSVGYGSRLPMWQRILLLSSGLIQEFNNFHSCYQSRVPTNAAVAILNIKLFNVFVHSQLCLQEDRYDTKGEEFRKVQFVWRRLYEGHYLQTFDKSLYFDISQCVSLCKLHVVAARVT